MLRKRVFNQRKRRKWPLFSGVWNSKFWGYLKEQVMAHIQNHTKQDIET
jgi:hypothetical protein